jgi:hypothetical protein
MLARLSGAALAVLCLLAVVADPADARRAKRSLAPVPVAGTTIDDRYPHLRDPEAHAIARAWQGRNGSLSGIVRPLAAKAREIVASCGSRVISGVRHSYVAGTRLVSLHASGRAVDISGNPKCIYRALVGSSGGYSTDYARAKHVHISYAPGGREWGARFAHAMAKKQRSRRKGAIA